MTKQLHWCKITVYILVVYWQYWFLIRKKKRQKFITNCTSREDRFCNCWFNREIKTLVPSSFYKLKARSKKHNRVESLRMRNLQPLQEGKRLLICLFNHMKWPFKVVNLLRNFSPFQIQNSMLFCKQMY